ncbi:unnamed protein product [Parajaminaea phylloscopi]
MATREGAPASVSQSDQQYKRKRTVQSYAEGGVGADNAIEILDADDDYDDDAELFEPTVASKAPPASITAEGVSIEPQKRPRGRPRKSAPSTKAAASSSSPAKVARATSSPSINKSKSSKSRSPTKGSEQSSDLDHLPLSDRLQLSASTILMWSSVVQAKTCMAMAESANVAVDQDSRALVNRALPALERLAKCHLEAFLADPTSASEEVTPPSRLCQSGESFEDRYGRPTSHSQVQKEVDSASPNAAREELNQQRQRLQAPPVPVQPMFPQQQLQALQPFRFNQQGVSVVTQPVQQPYNQQYVLNHHHQQQQQPLQYGLAQQPVLMHQQYGGFPQQQQQQQHFTAQQPVVIPQQYGLPPQQQLQQQQQHGPARPQECSPPLQQQQQE